MIRACTIRFHRQLARAGRWQVRLVCATAVVLCLMAFGASVCAQDNVAAAGQAQPENPEVPAPPDTFFPHSQTAKWWISGQANFVFQAHGTFNSPYSGPNSFTAPTEHALSRVMTLFTGYEFTPNTASVLRRRGGWRRRNQSAHSAWPDSSTSTSCVIRQLSQLPYIARLMFQQIIPFSKDRIESERTPLSLHTEMPVRRSGDSFRQVLDGRFLRQQRRRYRQSLPVHELDGRQQRRLGLRRRHPRLYRRS